MRSECESLTTDLFAGVPDLHPSQELMAEGAVLLRGFAKPVEADLIADLRGIVEQAPFRHMLTPGGYRMSVAMTNCGSVGWVTDRSGYRYDANDPETGKPWPAMPPSFRGLAEQAADEAGFGGFPLFFVGGGEEAKKKAAPVSAAAWRHRGMGRTGGACVSRRRAARRRR